MLRICHLSLVYQLRTLLELLQAPSEHLNHLSSDEERILTMLFFTFGGRNSGIFDLRQFVDTLKANAIFFAELIAVLNYLFEYADLVTAKPELPFVCPLELHANYTRNEILAALGNWTLAKLPEMREGVDYLKEINTDIFLITLNKTEKQYSPTTMYMDYAISDDLFHWQSQNRTSPESATGKCYLNGTSTVLLFVRENKNADGVSSSYCFLRPATYVSRSGSKPVNITRKLRYKIPARLHRMTECIAIA